MVKESLQRPSHIQTVLLILFALCPLPCIAFGLYYYHNAWLTIILFHIVLASLPLAYKVLFTDAHLLDYTAGELKDPLRELLYGLCASTAIVLFVMGPVSFVILKYKPFFLWIMGLDGMVCNDFAMDCENLLNPVLFAVYFSIVNPGIEECFWRVFLVKSLPADYKWIISALYANYHFFVCVRFVGIYQSLLGFSVTFAVGILMQELKERYGLLTVVCGHMAFDLCAMVRVM